MTHPSEPRVKVAHITAIDLSLRYLLLNQLRYLQMAGFEVIGISTPGPDVPVVEAAGVRHIAVPMRRHPFTPFHDLVSLFRLYRVIRREKLTIVHTHTPKPSLLGQMAARLAGVPVVVNTIHGFYFHDDMSPVFRWFFVTVERIAALFSDVILSQNSEDIETAIEIGISSPTKITYLGNGVDLQRFDPTSIDAKQLRQLRQEFGIPENAPVVGFVGRLVAEKGLLELLAAMRRVREAIPKVHLLIVGPVDEYKIDAITPDIARDYGLEDVAHFVGRRDDTPELYALMDLLVLPSYREGFPRAPMEASAMGIPCIVTDIRGCREVVEEGENGFLVLPRDVDTLTGAITKLLSDPALARKMGLKGREMAIEKFDERKVFAKVLSTYRRLLAEKGIENNDAQ